MMYGRACWRLDAYIRRLMGSLGRFVGEHPSHFVISPLLFGLFLATGLQRLVYQSDPQYLFFPSTSRTAHEKTVLQKLFPTNFSNYEIGKELEKDFEAHLIFVPKNDSTILRREYWKSISDLDQLIFENLTLVSDRNVTFKDLCVRYEGSCVRNTFLALREYMAEIRSGFLELTYPLLQNPTTYEMYQVPLFAGGLTFHEDKPGLVSNVRALRLSYVLSPELPEYAKLWLASLVQLLETVESPYLHIYKLTTVSIESEFASNVDSAIDFLPLSVGLLITYNILNALDWRQPILGKPYVSLLGSFNIVLAIGAAWGTLMYAGLEWISINLASVFILLGVGLDDVYVILFSWRRTSELLSVPERLSLCYEEAAVSITITSLTNIVSFIMGCAFPVFPSVWIFCLYSGIGICFIYLWTLTFFGGVLAISGYAEEAARERLMMKSPPEYDTGGSSEKSLGLNKFFAKVLPNILNTVSAKIVVILLYLTYLGVFIYIILTRTKEGLDRSKLSRYDSFLFSYYQTEDLYFRGNPYRFQVVFTEPLDYSNRTIRHQLGGFVRRVEESTYVSRNEEFKENWMDIFDQIAEKQTKIFNGWTVENDEHKFMDRLTETLDHHHIPAIRDNVIFNRNRTKIISSRIFLQSDAINDSHQEKLMIQDLYDIMDSAPFKVIIYNPYFLFFDQFLQVLPSTIYSVSITSLAVICITFLLIPNFVFTLWVTLALISIEIGVLGFMVILDISLDIISMICLIMCVGFSIDYSAHVSYHFVSMNIRNNAVRLRSTLTAYGPPIVQSAFSTILAVSGLFFLPSYIIQSFSKLLVIVICLGVVHGTILLPVLLSLTFCNSSAEESNVMEGSEDAKPDPAMDSALPLIVPPTLFDSHFQKQTQKAPNSRSRRRSDSFQRSGRARASVVTHEFMNRSNIEAEKTTNSFNVRSKETLSIPNDISSSEEDILMEENLLPITRNKVPSELTDEEPEMYI